MSRLKSANFAVTELVSGINNSVDSFVVDDASPFPDDGPFMILVHDNAPGFAGVREFMKIGGINKGTNTFSSVLRGKENTSAVAHSAGSRVECVWTAGTYEEIADDLDAHLVDKVVHVPSGGIIMWSGAIDAIPNGWVLCDGQNDTPDLRDRFIVGAGKDYDVGDTGGEENVTLSEDEMPSHSHSNGTLSASSAGSHSHSDGTLSASSAGSHSHTISSSASSDGSHSHSYVDRYVSPVHSVTNGFQMGDDNRGYYDSNTTTGSSGSHSHTISSSASSDGSHSHSVSGSTSSGGSHSHSVSGSTDSTGNGDAHENRPPYFALAFIMKL